MKTQDIKTIESRNSFSSDPLLFSIVAKMPPQLLAGFEELGSYVATSEANDLARLANFYRPVLCDRDRWGCARDYVEYHPAYHALIRRSKQIGLTSSLWEKKPDESGVRYQARAIRLFLMAGLETGHLMDISATSAGIAALTVEAELYRQWQPSLLSRQHDTSSRPIDLKRGTSFSFAFYEGQNAQYQSHADLQSFNEQEGRNRYRLKGRKVRVGNPQADGFFVTAFLGGQLSCFFIPRFIDGATNHFSIVDMDSQYGIRSRALCKIDFDGAIGWLIGQAGQGEKTISDIETMLRFDQVVMSAGIMRACVREALDWRRLYAGDENELLSARVLADIALDVAAAECLVMRLAHAFDMAATDRAQAAFARIMTPVIAFWVNGLVGPVVNELVIQAGAGAYTDGSLLARSLVDSPARMLNEMDGNHLVADVLTSSIRAPSLFQELLASFGEKIGAGGQRTVEVLQAAAQISTSDAGSGRLLCEQLAYAAAAAALNEYDTDVVAQAFVESRLGGQWRSSYGMLSARHNSRHILEVLYPEV